MLNPQSNRRPTVPTPRPLGPGGSLDTFFHAGSDLPRSTTRACSACVLLLLLPSSSSSSPVPHSLYRTDPYTAPQTKTGGPLARRPCPRSSCIYQIQFQFSLDAICISPVHSSHLPVCHPPIRQSIRPLGPSPSTHATLAPTRVSLCLSRGHSVVTQSASLLPRTQTPQSEPVPFLCCSLSAWNGRGLLRDCRLSKLHTYPKIDIPSNRGLVDPRTRRHRSPPIHTLSYAFWPPLAIRQPTRPHSFRSRIHHTSLRLTIIPRVSSRLPPTSRPACTIPTSPQPRGCPGTGSEGTTRIPALPLGLTIHEPCTALQLAAPRVL